MRHHNPTAASTFCIIKVVNPVAAPVARPDHAGQRTLGVALQIQGRAAERSHLIAQGVARRNELREDPAASHADGKPR